MYERFTDRARKVMQLANQEAQRFNHEYIGTEHILLGLVKEGAGVAANVLKKLGIELRKVRLEVEKIVQTGPDMVTMGSLPQTPRAKKVIEYAIEEARYLNHNYVGTEHVLLGLLREQEGVAAQVLMNLGLKLENVREEVLTMLGQNPDLAESGKALTLALSRFGLDHTEAVRRGMLAPIVGRQAEVERVLRVLLRRTRSNPLLVGLPGCGKTSVVRGIAERLVAGGLPPRLCEQRLVVLDLPLLIAKAEDFTGCVKQVKAVVSEVRQAKNIILFIDDLHALARSGEACLPLIVGLVRGEIRCIAATSTAEFRQYIEPDSALARCFQPINVTPADSALTLEILRQVKSHYETHHHVTITDDALAAVAELAERQETQRALPGKAIDVLDEAAASLALRNTPAGPDFREIDGRIDKLNVEKEQAVAEQDFEKAAHLRDQADKLKKTREKIKREWQAPEQPIAALDAAAVAAVAKEMSADEPAKRPEGERIGPDHIIE
jgi:ATP-dependent Clp protease ATP-binding subunit ClpC